MSHAPWIEILCSAFPAKHAIHRSGVGELVADLSSSNARFFHRLSTANHCTGQIRIHIASATECKSRIRGVFQAGLINNFFTLGWKIPYSWRPYVNSTRGVILIYPSYRQPCDVLPLKALNWICLRASANWYDNTCANSENVAVCCEMLDASVKMELSAP